ncbi:MAG: transcriptional regulator [Methanobacteriota archaeon]|nr:MAG: transcriptional regulator [Euryarchaeota archaeon]
MPHRITEPGKAEALRQELRAVIAGAKTFSENLKTMLRESDIDIALERKATVEALQVILQKWVVEIIHVLFLSGPQRFSDIKRSLTGISSRTLTAKLRLLEDAGFIKRDLIKERPIITEYSLTEKGKTIAELSCPIILYLKLEGIDR